MLPAVQDPQGLDGRGPVLAEERFLPQHRDGWRDAGQGQHVLQLRWGLRPLRGGATWASSRHLLGGGGTRGVAENEAV